MKKVFLIVSVIIFIWCVFFVLTVAEKLSYNPPSNAEPFEIFADNGIYNLLIAISVFGVTNSVMMFVSMRMFFKSGKKNNTLKKVFLAMAVVTNVLFYFSALLLFAINKDFISIFILLYVLCFVVCILLLLALLAKNILSKHSENT